MTTVVGQDVVYSDRYFKFGQCLSGVATTLPPGSLNKIILTDPGHMKYRSQRCYMPVFNSLEMKYGIYPGILISENQVEATTFKRLGDIHQMHQMLPIIKSISGKESFSPEYKLSTVENQVTDIFHKDTRSIMSRVSLSEKMASKELERMHSLVEWPATDVKLFLKEDVPVLEREETYPLLPTLSSGHKFDDHRSAFQGLGHANTADSKTASVSKPSSSHCLSSSSSKITSKGGFKMPDVSYYEFLPQSDGCETVQKCNTLETKGYKLPRTCMDQIMPVPEQQVLKYNSTPSSTYTDIQGPSLSSVEPYPLPEASSLLLLEPYLLMQQDNADGSSTPMLKKHKKRKEQMNHSEQQKVARIMIGYTLAFFLLAIVTFYVVYFI
jgi:hypothetical protein